MSRRRPYLPDDVPDDRRAEDPVETLSARMDRLVRMMISIGAFLGVLSALGFAFGWRWVSPGAGLAQMATTVTAVTSQVDSLRDRVQTMETNQADGIYMMCEVMRRVSPGSIQPKACGDARIIQRAR